MPKREFVITVTGSTEEALDRIEVQLKQIEGTQKHAEVKVDRLINWVENTLGIKVDLDKFIVPPPNSAVDKPKIPASQLLEQLDEAVKKL